jgi:hypothetical protein
VKLVSEKSKRVFLNVSGTDFVDGSVRALIYSIWVDIGASASNQEQMGDGKFYRSSDGRILVYVESMMRRIMNFDHLRAKIGLLWFFQGRVDIENPRPRSHRTLSSQREKFEKKIE